ncbi:hypothetical protein DESME_04640 [Desulfitobacterium metallireducens DSM 15288]|uniref:Uncharacterized protein n=1 Tax=Desulfitobacterium metallireducens DSM 15288 TaxID=871968 RepID=W0EHD0_9FIRM|nr:hypothetical protein DESME_04640 [Desulfitobacterium metallireducens DSM 15288]
MALNLLSPLQNKNSMQKKGLLTNLVVAQSAVLLEKLKTETTVDTILAHNAKCSLQPVPTAEKKQQFLSNLLVTDLYIAVNVTNPVLVTATGRI